MEKAKYDVFISYSRKDLELVKDIKKEIDRLVGIDCWMDLDGIESGEQFEDVIISAIDRSDTLLFMMSRSSMTSEWALDEIDFAKRKGKRIVLIAIERVEMTDKFYFRYHKYDNIDWNNLPQREKLIRDLRKWFNKKHSVCQHDEQTLNTSITTIQTDAAEVHIEVDADCDLYIFKKKIATLKPNEDNIIHLKPGTYMLDFVSCKYSDIKKSLTYQLGVGIFSDVKKISLKEAINQRDQAEGAKRRTEDEVKRKEKKELDCLHEIEQNGKYGFANEKGEIVIACQWLYVGVYREGLSLVKDENGKWGYIDKRGTLVIPCIWDAALPFSEGLAPVGKSEIVKKGLFKKEVSIKWGYINTIGKLVIPCAWNRANFFSEGLASVMNKDGLYGYIDTMGKVIIPCQWFYSADPFKNGQAKVRMSIQTTPITIDRNGNVIAKLRA